MRTFCTDLRFRYTPPSRGKSKPCPQGPDIYFTRGVMPENLQDAIDFALAQGLLKYNTSFQLTHAPFALLPYQINGNTLNQLTILTPFFNELMLKVANDSEFLKAHLQETSQADSFVKNLLDLLADNRPVQPYQMMITRSDYLLHETDKTGTEPVPKQVEFNMISNSFVYLSRQIFLLHKYLFDNQQLDEQPIEHHSFDGVVDAMATAVKYHGHENSCLLMIVQQKEQNLFDQRALEYRLLEKYAIPTVRSTLEAVAANGRLKDGHLYIGDRLIALTYFRAGYAPDDYLNPDAWQGRKLIETSSTIKVPTIGMQLAGAKKIQQVLCKPGVLQRYVSEAEAALIEKTFVGLYALDESVGDISVIDMALANPGDYVLKPQREGGGNNYFDDDMVDQLKTMSHEERKAYILMERIKAPVHDSVLVVEQQTSAIPCVSEIGRFGVCLAKDDNFIFNQDAGYLVRTKSEDENEGGVCAGYACLNTLSLR